MNVSRRFTKRFVVFCLAALSWCISRAQEDLLGLADREVAPVEDNPEQTFKGTRLINGHSIETRQRGVLDVIISHRFGRLNSGAYELFGLDESNVRLGVDYAATDRLTFGAGRNSFEKTFDGFVKYRILRQGAFAGREAPLSVTGFSSIAVKTLKNADASEEPSFNSRLTYAYQLMMARRFSPSLSFQVMPSLVHRNSVREAGDDHDIFALGVGGRINLTRSLSLNAEYYYRFNDPRLENSVAVGFDIETGGHVFQLHFTNSRAMIEKGFIAETTGDFLDGDIHFGFNISRTFQLHD